MVLHCELILFLFCCHPVSTLKLYFNTFWFTCTKSKFFARKDISSEHGLGGSNIVNGFFKKSYVIVFSSFPDRLILPFEFISVFRQKLNQAEFAHWITNSLLTIRFILSVKILLNVYDRSEFQSQELTWSVKFSRNGVIEL